MLTDNIQKQAIQHLIDKTGCQNWALSGLKVTARQCSVYQLCSPEYPKEIALKIYHDKKTSRQLQGQYKALERFSGAMNQQNTEYRTPEPYGCFAEQDYFLMEWVSAPSLDKQLWRYFHSHKRQQAAIEKTYRWLKYYHQVATPTLQEVNGNHYVQQLESHIEKYDTQNLLSKNNIFTNGLKTLNKCSSNFSDLQINHADAHGDFTPTNILLGNKNVTAIDIGRGQKMPIENDMALMLNYITIDFPNMLTRRHMQKPTDTWTILNIALDAYDYPKNEQQRSFFLFVFLYQTIRRWLIINDRNIKKSRLLDRWRLRNSERIVEGLVKALSDNSRS